MKLTKNLTSACSQSGTLDELLFLWRKQAYAQDPDQTDYRKLMQTNPALEMVLGMSPCLSWILDTRTQSFILISNNIEQVLGYKASSFRQYGLVYVNEIMHPEDKKTIWRQTVDLWKNLQTLPASQKTNFSFSRKFRLRRANGTYITLLEQNSVLQTDSLGNITHVLSVFSDITDLIKNNGAANTFPASTNQALILKSKSESLKPDTKLSKRERQIVRLVAEGYSSKIIADQLFISYHTVNTHRRNIIEKTHTRNTSGLVQFAINHRII